MSAITRRPVISQVAQIDFTKNVMTTAQLIQKSLQSLSKGMQLVYQAAAKALTQPEVNRSAIAETAMHSTFQLQQSQPQIQQMVEQLAQQQGLSPLETLQVSTLVAANQLQVESPQLLEQSLQSLLKAPSLAIAQQASHTALEQLSMSHHNLFVEQLTQACTQAAFKVGFKQLVQVPVRIGNTIRLVANDETGKSLVTEIQVAPDQPISLATELIGTSDSVCQDILDAYDRALEETGVRSNRPERKFTGGIYELDAARDFVRRTVKPKPKTQVQGSSKSQQTARPLPKKARLSQQQ